MHFTPQQKSVRKQWLIWTIISALIWPLATFAISLYYMKELSVHFWTYFWTGAVLIAFVFWILVRCAYVKPGIKFLTVCLALGPIYKIKGIVDAWHFDAVTVTSIAVNLAVYAWWYYLSIKLWKMNQSLKRSS